MPSGLAIAIAISEVSGADYGGGAGTVDNFIQQDGFNFVQQDGISVFLIN
jgi:hypothetical protein